MKSLSAKENNMIRAKGSQSGLALAIILAVSCSMSAHHAPSRDQVQLKTSPPGMLIAGKDMTRGRLPSIIQGLSDDGISTFHRWQVDENTTLTCMVIDRKEKEFPGEPTNSVVVLNKAGFLLYEEKNVEVTQLAVRMVLRNSRWQLVLYLRNGGRGGSLQILDYADGKIVKLLKDVENAYAIWATLKPSFRPGISPSSEPYEISFIDGIGLPSPVEKTTRVYRYSNGAYEYAGTYSQTKVDEFIDKSLK
jgi:hypothetical protein